MTYIQHRTTPHRTSPHNDVREQVKYMVDELGFDAGINYKTQDIAEALKKAAPNGVDR